MVGLYLERVTPCLYLYRAVRIAVPVIITDIPAAIEHGRRQRGAFSRHARHNVYNAAK